MRVQNTFATAVGNVFIDISHFVSYTITSILSGLSNDDDVQLLMCGTDYSHIPMEKSKIIRKINKYTISDFLNKLSNELWDTIFNSDDVSAVFNAFLNVYLRIFCPRFPP